MATLEELKRQNEKLKNEIAAKEEMAEIGRQRNKLLKENKKLLRQKKFGGAIKVSKRFGKVSVSVGKKTGKTVGRTLLKIARNIAESERREEQLRKKVSKIKRKPTKRKAARNKTRRR